MIYFAQAGVGGPIKIGVTTANLERRMAGIQNGCPAKLVIIGVKDGDAAEEKRLHRLFQEHRLRGEWFAPHPDLLSAIKAMASPAPRKSRVLEGANIHPIQRYRAEHDLTLREFAKLVGTSGPSISRYEKGQRKITPRQIARLVEVTGIPARALRPDLWNILYGDAQP